MTSMTHWLGFYAVQGPRKLSKMVSTNFRLYMYVIIAVLRRSRHYDIFKWNIFEFAFKMPLWLNKFNQGH